MKTSKWRLQVIIFLALALMFVLAACGTDGNGNGNGDGDNAEGSDDEGGDVEESELEDTYTVVSDNSFVPFEFMEDGELVGFDIDLINAVADEAGFEIDMETTNFDGIIPGLQTGQFDIAIAGIGITEERKEVIDYSDPYFESGLAIGVPADNEDIEGIEDLEGKEIATRLGSTSATYIEENIDGAEGNEFEQLDQAYLSVENGSTDAVLYDDPNVRYYIQTAGDDLKVVGDLYQAEDYGIAITPGNEELVEAINESLATLRENGTYEEIYEEWFGSAE
ncbi:glutamine transport system substrate-binding protein [Virgibacillus natechei]|uniref:Glutamine transport system substrate-binding protein n=1 Tax=Virgibacillus natechei TaxID=1216297 RepID=A0ABS4IHW9_9BACI|nr:transporter substrate-binding domain-containing protein [Virgibacillus natechei]MBP1970531.1 glutamine transport system substrate-binding protein [Virgibacillus natechei]UZD14066.1 transporter substrate-binding domain-containing protein [Virgibacillus natechei]